MQAYKFELRPTGDQANQMRRFAGSCRFVYNKALALQIERYAAGEKKLSFFDLCGTIKDWRHEDETSWLSESPSQALQQKIKDLETAYSKFFAKSAGFPKFKKRGQCDSFRYQQNFKVDQQNSRLYLPKIGWVLYRNSREILGELRNITVSESCGKWYASVCTKREVGEPVHPSSSSVGIDMGITRFATLSDGTFIEPINAHRKSLKKLAKAQRRLARKKRFSSNWKKQRNRISKIHRDVANSRKDFLHKVSTTISKNHAIVFIEDLKVSNMSKSASRTVESPGVNVSQKSGLNRSILDQGWYEFRRQLEYKQSWAGGTVIAVHAHHTSQTCPACGYVSPENRRTQSSFVCVDCGFSENADYVGALNVLTRGLRVTACGGLDNSHPLKQEPTDGGTEYLRRNPLYRLRYREEVKKDVVWK